ncbi:MAG TPA: PAS domain S-box protein [Bryobacteraceae bacterium]|nr:PAS domain S-box protein [Bryobacteraceae bacterium]
MSDSRPATNTLPKTSGTKSSGKAAATGDQFQALVDDIPDYAIFLLDADGRVATWNQGAANIKGYSAAEILGRNFSVFFSDEDIRAGKPQNELRQAAKHGCYAEEGWRVRKDGSRFWAHVTLTTLRSGTGELRGFVKVTRDAGERLSLREGSDRFWTLFHSVRVGAVLAGPNAEVLMFNAAACELIGVAPNQLRGKTSYDLEWEAVYEDGSPCPGQEHPIPRAIATGEAVRNVVLGVRRPKLGDWVWLLVNAEPRLDPDGRVKEVMCTFTDITQRKRAEAGLVEWKNRYEAAIRASGQILYDSVSATGEVTYGGDTEKVLGYRSAELAGGFDRWLELIHEDDRQAFIDENLRIQANRERFQQVYRFRKKDGTLILVKDIGEVYFDAAGKILGMVGYVSDITGQKRAEERLRASEERFRGVFTHAAVGMAIADLEGRFQKVNRALCEITGYSEQELTARTFFSITHPDDFARNQKLTRRMIAGEIPNYVIEKRYLHKNGSVVWVRVSCFLLKDAQGRPERVVGLLEDITERKHAEEALQELSRRLLRLQDEERRRLARELHDSTAQSLAALGMNLGVVTEEAKVLTSRAQRALGESLVLADQCLRELRTFSYVLHPPVLDDLGIASALSWFVEGFVERSGIQVTVDIPHDLGRLPQEVELTLFRVVQESLTNIHRHSGSREASIRISRTPAEIVLEVADNGMEHSGLSQGAVPHLGVGVASMRERVREIGGRFEIVSESRGTKVRAIIPRSPAAG